MHFCQEVFLYRIYEVDLLQGRDILNVKSPVPTFLSFPKPFSLRRPTKMFISGKSGSFSDFEFSLREIFITDGSDRVCTLLEIYHLFSRGYI